MAKNSEPVRFDSGYLVMAIFASIVAIFTAFHRDYASLALMIAITAICLLISGLEYEDLRTKRK